MTLFELRPKLEVQLPPKVFSLLPRRLGGETIAYEGGGGYRKVAVFKSGGKIVVRHRYSVFSPAIPGPSQEAGEEIFEIPLR